MGNIPGSHSPTVPFPTLANQMAAYDTSPAVPGRIPGAYGEGANTPDPAPAVRFKVGKFDNGQPEETAFEKNGSSPDTWGYTK